ncbi:Coiled-coil domain-containing protein 38 [Podochytrium sp. JEL0797]|nr:Coiled-coil domain-containing protein 38 [Podochytrium sp. JEL0797]
MATSTFTITDQNMTLLAKGTWLVAIHAAGKDWQCPFSEDLVQRWDSEVASVLRSNTSLLFHNSTTHNIALVDACENTRIAALLEVQAYPTVKLIQKGLVWTYRDDNFSSASIVEFATDGWKSNGWYNKIPATWSVWFKLQLDIFNFASTPRSKILKLPEITNEGQGSVTAAGLNNASRSRVAASQSSSKNSKNPFHMPSDMEVFAMREEERRQKLEEKEKSKTLHIYEKNVTQRKNFKDLLAEETDDIDFYDKLRKRDADKILINRQARADKHFGKENLHDFIAKKREMFLVQYALGVKRQEMRKLEEIAQAEEQKLLDDEKALEEDAAKFDAFLKENDKNSVEAIKKAELETKAKLEKIQEIKKLNVQIMTIRSDMSKNEDQLKDLQKYRQFLDKLTPKEFFEENAKLKKPKYLESNKKPASENGTGSAGGRFSTLAANGPKSVVVRGKKNSKSPKLRGDTDGSAAEAAEEANTPATANTNEDDEAAEEEFDFDDDYWTNSDDEALLYFKTPQQLLDLFSELEENNLALIQNCQETEETLEELKQKIVETEQRMEKETQSLTQQIEFLNTAIEREEDKAKQLEERAKMFSNGLVGVESQEKLLEDLNHKVKEVYRKCIGDSDANLNTLQMLTNIENKLEQLFETIENMPRDKVEQAEKTKDKERRRRLREEKMETQRLLQEKRVQIALERAKAPVKKKVGKPVVFRSAPPQKKKKKEEFTKKKEEEDLEYYFSFA